MDHSLKKHTSHQDEAIASLEQEIADLESELQLTENQLNSFIAQIRSRLHYQILRIRELSELYKKQKKAKKEKRLEQKKRGKNWKEPTGLKRTEYNQREESKLTIDEQQELKRLYKEAIVHVHPDKFSQESEQLSEKATALTVQLIDIYQSGDLDELKGFHEHILSGNAMSHIPYQPESIADPKAMLAFLHKKKEELLKSLTETKDSQIYVVLTTYEQPLTFIDELRIQFDQKIAQLEKRTRKG